MDEAVFLGSRVLVMSPRPGRIVLDRSAVFTADAPGTVAPGAKVAPEDIRTLPAYVALRDEVRAAIQEEVRV